MSLTNYCPSPLSTPRAPTGTARPPCTTLARGQELTAGFILNFTYLEDISGSWGHCHFSVHHHASPPRKPNAFPSLHSLPKKLRCQEKKGDRWTTPKETIWKQSDRSSTELVRTFLVYLIIAKPVITQKHTRSDDLSGCGKNAVFCWCFAALGKKSD